jgi:hypothetical protein
VQNSEEARTVDLHGDNHPPVSLRLGSTSLDYGRNAGEMVLQVYVVGAVHGFSYQIIVQVMTEAGHVQHQGVTDFSMDNGPGMEVAVVLPLPEARDRYRLAIGMWDSYIGIQGQPEALVARKDIQLSLPPRRTSPVAVPKKDSVKEEEQVRAAGGPWKGQPGWATGKGEEVEESMHGEFHPLVTLRVGSTPLVYRGDAGRMELTFKMDGAIPGFTYLVYVHEYDQLNNRVTQVVEKRVPLVGLERRRIDSVLTSTSGDEVLLCTAPPIAS